MDRITRTRQRGRDRGSAAVEFALVAPLLLVLAVAVVQVALALHVRVTLTAAAAEGARAASLAGADPAAGIVRAREVLAANIASSVVRDVRATRAVIDGLPVMVVRIDAAVPLVGLLGPEAMTVEGHALQEGWS
jgi:Flp pilus assembly protein TadG